MINPRSLIAMFMAAIASAPYLASYTQAQDGAFGSSDMGGITTMERELIAPKFPDNSENWGAGYRTNRIVLPPDIYGNLESAPDSFRQFNEYILVENAEPIIANPDTTKT